VSLHLIVHYAMPNSRKTRCCGKQIETKVGKARIFLTFTDAKNLVTCTKRRKS
jgi:hypothetical protein